MEPKTYRCCAAPCRSKDRKIDLLSDGPLYGQGLPIQPNKPEDTLHAEPEPPQGDWICSAGLGCLFLFVFLVYGLRWSVVDFALLGVEPTLP